MNPLREKARTFGRNVERFGLRSTLVARLAGRLARHLGVHVCVVRVGAMSPSPERPTLPTGIVLRELDLEDLFRAVADPRLSLDRESTDAAIARGDIAFGAFHGSELVSYHWRSAALAPHKHGIWVQISPPCCYAYKSFTRTDYRGQRILPALVLFADERMLQLGFSHRAAFVGLSNLPSLAISSHTNYKAIGYAGYFERFGYSFCFRTPAVKRIGFAFVTL